jgi:ketosteroid isomerase-like protein
MQDDEKQIRTLIERWAKPVHSGELEGVVADHSDDIVMFDVPPPEEGVHGIDAYRETWPPFFEWQAQGASFEIVSIEVTAGDDVAYAHALLRCGTPQELAEQPANRLVAGSNPAPATGKPYICRAFCFLGPVVFPLLVPI